MQSSWKKSGLMESKMFFNITRLSKLSFIFLISVLAISCVTETIESPSMRFTEAAVISVQDPNFYITQGSTFAWLPEAVRFYKDERLQNSPVKTLLESEITKNILAKGMIFVESINGAKYSIAYTAALESSLDDDAIINRFGLMPGNAQIPKNDASIEKGTLVVYVFDNRTGDIIWRSAAQVGVRFNTPDSERKQRIERVLAEMFQTFSVAR